MKKTRVQEVHEALCLLYCKMESSNEYNQAEADVRNLAEWFNDTQIEVIDALNSIIERLYMFNIPDDQEGFLKNDIADVIRLLGGEVDAG